MNHPAAPRLPTIPLPRVDAHRRESAVPYGSNVHAPPSVHAVLGGGLIYDTSIASTSRLEAFSTNSRPLARAILDAPAVDRHTAITAAVTFPTLRARVFIGSADGHRSVSVRDILDAIDAVLRHPMPCAHDRIHGCPACSLRRADSFGTRFLSVHVQSTSVGDFGVSLFAQTP